MARRRGTRWSKSQRGAVVPVELVGEAQAQMARDEEVE